MNPEAVAQLARLAGHAAFFQALGVPEREHLPGLDESGFDSTQMKRLHQLIDARLGPIVAGLLREAMASDDVQAPAAADAYLDDRLGFLGDLLTAHQRAEIRRRFRAESASWR